jgi:ubiquitin carboxyl-terminal hydrolase 4/11/15
MYTPARLKYTGQKEGDTWYVISSAWYNRWKNVCAPNKYRADDSDLGPVDNSDIVDEQGNLYPALAESEKYEVLCKEAWDQFVDWYDYTRTPLRASRLP